MDLKKFSDQQLQDLLQYVRYSPRGEKIKIELQSRELKRQQKQQLKQKIQNQEINLENLHESTSPIAKIRALKQKEIDEIINKTDKYQTNEQILFFREYVEQILLKHLGDLVKFDIKQLSFHQHEFIDYNYLFTITEQQILKIKEFLEKYSIQQESDQVGSDYLYQYLLLHCDKIVFQSLKQSRAILRTFDSSNKTIQQSEIPRYFPETNQKKSGAYLNYYCDIPQLQEVLKICQIGIDQETHEQLNLEHCFIYSLQQAEVPKDRIQFIQSQIVEDIDFLDMREINKLKGIEDIQITCYDIEDKVRIIKKATTSNIIELGLYQKHYFFDKMLNITLNYLKRKQFDLPLNISNMTGKALSKKYIKLGLFLKELFNQKLMKPVDSMNVMNAKIIEKQRKNQEIELPEKIDCYVNTQDEYQQQKDNNQVADKVSSADANEKPKTIYADTEAFTVDSKGDFIKHQCFMICWEEEDNNQKFNGLNFNSLFNNYRDSEFKKFLIYFHNLTYDAQFLLKDYSIFDTIQANGKLIKFTVKANNKQFEFRDSLRLLSCPLKDLNEMFLGGKEEKELFPYQYYTKQRYLINKGDIDESLKFMSCSKDQFISSINKSNSKIGGSQSSLGCANNQTYDMKQYCLYYCQQDVNILKLSMIKFKSMLKEEFDLDLQKYLSISSLSLDYQKNKQCFKDCSTVSGILRQYIQQFVVGGRCMTKNNEKHNVKANLSDFDAVSLYPSAQKRCYYPCGVPKKLTKEQIQFYNNPQNLFKIKEEKESLDQNTLFVSVKLSNPKIIRSFPLLSNVNENGIRQFSNTPEQNKIYHLSHIYLQDLVTFQGYEYEIIDGIYFEQRNYQIQETIAYMFDQRVKYKKLKNPIQQIYKLMLNSSYGKTIEKLHITSGKVFQKEDFMNYCSRNFNIIDSVKEFEEVYFVNELNQVITTQDKFNYIGVIILDMSKRLMNEVMCLAEDLDIKIYYQDTDSMHIEKDKLDLLRQEFQKKYNRELIGKGQGQYHSDFESDKGEVLHSEKLIALGKKFYIDQLVVKTPEGQIVRDFHIRGKGVSKESILYEAEQNYNGDVMKLYEDLYNGKEIEFDLCCNRPLFKKDVYAYECLNEFKRKVSFRSDAK